MSHASDGPARHAALQRRRRALQLSFFALFLLAPALDLLRFDLTQTQLWVLGFRWTLGIDAFLRGEADATTTALAIIGRGIAPAVLLAVAFLAVARRYGRLYCGWLCPHFSLVELINRLMWRAGGRHSLWEPASGPSRPLRWPLVALGCIGFGSLWAVTLLTYLLPPATVWRGLADGTLSAGATRFVVVASVVFSAELLLARHLFCRFGCAVGFFQSLAWMSNRRALVIGFDRDRAADCRGCATPGSPAGDACEDVCPMRLEPRRQKRWMFSCVQCGRCASACATSHAARGSMPTLQWTVGADALRESLQRRRREAAMPGGEG